MYRTRGANIVRDRAEDTYWRGEPGLRESAQTLYRRKSVPKELKDEAPSSVSNFNTWGLACFWALTVLSSDGLLGCALQPEQSQPALAYEHQC